jgi:hypothetical protein
MTGNFRTINWPYRPILTQSDRLQWAAKTEFGHYYTVGEKLQSVLPNNAVILTPDMRGPYYLRRKAYWADFSCGKILNDWWGEMGTKDAHQIMLERGVTHLLVRQTIRTDTRILEMYRLGLIELIDVEGMDERWKLYLVKGKQ